MLTGEGALLAMPTDAHRRVARAAEHQRDLTRRIEEYAAQPPYLRRDTLGQGTVPRVIDATLAIMPPLELSLVFADVLQNLSAALDYMVCELVRRAGHQPERWHSFPLTNNQSKYTDAWIGRRLEGVPSVAAGLIKELQPWHEDHAPLWSLAELSRVARHQLLPTTGSVTRHQFVAHDFDKEREGQPVFMASADGRRAWYELPLVHDERDRRVQAEFKVEVFLWDADHGGWRLEDLAATLVHHVQWFVLPAFDRFWRPTSPDYVGPVGGSTSSRE